MKRTASLLLLGAMLLSLAACGKTAKESPAPATTAPVETTAAVEETTPVEETAAPNDTEEHVVSGIVNRLGDYLTLLADDEYLVFDLGEGVSTEGLEEGDQVTVVYTGDLGSEETPPVVTQIAKD